MLQETLGTAAAEEGTFQAGEARLFRRSVRPQGRARVRLALLHGYGEHCGRYAHLQEWLAERGIASHTFDFRGQGRSSGRRGHVSPWEQYLEDLEAFLAQPALHAEADEPLFLLGHSHGGLILAAAAIRGLTQGARGLMFSAPFMRRRLAVPRAKILVGRLLDPILPWLPLDSGLKPEWMSRDPAMVEESRRDRLIVHTATPRWFFGMLEAQAMVMSGACAIVQPLLVLIGEEDPVADPVAEQQFFELTGAADKQCRHYPGFLHEILRESGRERVFDDILGWIGQHTSPAED